ncbi:MAG TPA: ABC-2 family transporter protein [Chloroflexota bacterium]|nr:ABC-2 family transporter protein [Chloroflexota bacterium]
MVAEDLLLITGARRLVRLWALYGRMDLLFFARGPHTALPWYLSEVVVALAAVTATFLLAERFDGIGTWTRPQVYFLLGYALLVHGLIETFFSYNIAFISRRIGRGQLDHMFIEPLPLWMILLAEGFAPVGATSSLLPGVGLLLWAASQLHLAVGVAWWGLFLVNVVASMAVVLAFAFAWGSLAFWAPRAAEELNSSTYELSHQLAPFPLDGLSGIALASLVTVVPVGLVAWYPSRILLGLEAPPWAPALLPAAALAFVALATWIFRRGLRNYGRTGSTRYSDSGHRR